MLFKYRNIAYFSGLNALRFFAAMLVLLDHGRMIRANNGFRYFEKWSLFANGGTGVSFFFVLSGFLITYLLLNENETTGTIGIKRFYLRRVLRIWPLYFLVVLIGLAIIPSIARELGWGKVLPFGVTEVWMYYAVFLPCVANFLFGPNLLAPLWSIGVEEFFYLIWAPLLKLFTEKRILVALIGVPFIKLVLVVAAHLVFHNPLLSYIVNVFSIEAMVLGGWGAYFLFYRKRPLESAFIYKRSVQVLVYSLLLAYVLFNQNINWPVWIALFKTPGLSKILPDFLYLYLIIGVAAAGNNLFKLKSRVLDFLGEISYGIYMYHMFVVFFIIRMLRQWLSALPGYMEAVVFYVFTIGITICVAALSRYTFEAFFLKFKTSSRRKSESFKPWRF